MLGLGVPAAVALAVFGLVVYVDVTLTFESRRGVAPSRVYSDGMRLEAGAPFDVEQLATWLRRADYVATEA